MAGAIVFVRWRLHKYESELTELCLHLDMTRTDARGDYSIPEFRKLSAGAIDERTNPVKISPWIEVYQIGYGRDREFRPPSMTLPRWRGSADERMVLLAILQEQSACDSDSPPHSYGVTADIHRALLQEAEGLALLRPESQAMLNQLRNSVKNRSARVGT